MTPTQPPSTRILLARHGEVDAVHRGTIYGALDVPLSETGVAQSQALARALKGVHLDAVVSSGLQRAETAAGFVRAGRRGIQRQDDARFRELDRGDWAAMPIETLRRDNPEGFRLWIERRGAVQAPGGESLKALRERSVPGFQHWADLHPGGAVLIVAHLWIVRSAICEVLKVPMDRSPMIGLPPGGVAELSWPVGSTDSPRARPELISLGSAS